MAAVSRSDYPEILRLVDVEVVKTSDVARRYGVVPRTINIILGKARAAGIAPAAAPGAAPPAGAEPEAAPPESVTMQAPVSEAEHDFPVVHEDLTLADCEPLEAEALEPSQDSPWIPLPGLPAAEPSLPRVAEPAPRPVPARTPEPAARERPVRSLLKGSGANSPRSAGVKAAFGLVMRGEDGEENVAPFGSIDELLAAAKGVLRKAAAGDERVWLSVSRIDPSDFANAD